MRKISVIILLALSALHGHGQLCQTIASGSLTDVNNWLCDCNIVQCDTLLIAHEMTVDDTLLLENAVYTEVTNSGSIGGSGSIKIAGSLLNQGVISVHRLATDVDPFPEFNTYFINQGIVQSPILLLLSDSTLNQGEITNTDSLIIGVYRKFYNASSLYSRIIFGLGPLVNSGTLECDSLTGARQVVNYSSLSCTSVLEAYSLLYNAGTILASNYEQWSGRVDNRGAINVNATATLGLYGGIQFEQTPNARLTTRNLYVLEDTDIRGLGSVCILEHAENHGNLIGSMQLCDLTPTMTTPPYWDVHTGTIVLNPTYCGPLACATVDVGEVGPSASAKLYPNPSTGLVQVELAQPVAAIHSWVLLDALGRRVKGSTGTFLGNLSLDLTGHVEGTYWLELRGADGAVMERLRVVIMR